MEDYFTSETKAVRDMIREDPDHVRLTDEQYHQRVDQMLEKRIQWAKQNSPAIASYYSSLTFRTRRQLEENIYESVRGLGILGKLMEDKSITEIMINGYDTIFVERNGKLEKLPDRFESPTDLQEKILKFLGEVGRSASEESPIVDARLGGQKDASGHSNESRVNVVMPPIALNGPVVTIRRFPEEGMTIQKLISYGSITPEAAAFLEKLVRARYNIFISGGTGSGKTTFLNALSNFIPQDERVITIEDSAELQIRHIPNLVRLEARTSSASKETNVTIRDLIRSSLRMRPDRIIVGEVRGAEALDMLQAMNTGHDGSLSTGHANTARDMISRLETMVLQGAEGLPLSAIEQQIESAVDIIIHLARMRDRSRKTLSISEVNGIDPVTGKVQLHTLFEFQEDRERSTTKRVVGNLVRVADKMENPAKFESAGIYDYF